MNQNYNIPESHLKRLTQVYRTTWQSWSNARSRCYNDKMTAYDVYGARGIRMADCWLHDFQAFLTYMGPRPHNMTLDRIAGGTSHYEPGNVRWATQDEQHKNRTLVKKPKGTRRQHKLVFQIDGQQVSAQQLADRLGINKGALITRVKKYGWTLDQLLGKEPRPARVRRYWRTQYTNDTPIGPQTGQPTDYVHSRTRQAITLTWQDRTQTIAQWSKETGIHKHTIRSRMDRGWSVEDTLTK